MSIIERGMLKEDEINPLEEEEEEEEEEDYDENTKLINKEDSIEKIRPSHGESSHINPAFEDEGLKTPFSGQSLNTIFREELKKTFPNMNDSVEVSQVKGRLSIRIYDSKTKWTPVYTKKMEINKKMTNELKKALGPSNEEIIKQIDEKREIKTQRKEELELQELRTDISPEVRETITNEIEKINEEVAALNEENVLIK